MELSLHTRRPLWQGETVSSLPAPHATPPPLCSEGSLNLVVFAAASPWKRKSLAKPRHTDPYHVVFATYGRIPELSSKVPRGSSCAVEFCAPRRTGKLRAAPYLR